MLFNALLRENLIDVYRLMVHPVVIGHGNHLFGRTDDHLQLKVTDAKHLQTGIVIIELVRES
jgi:dihydrofolate reductase